MGVKVVCWPSWTCMCCSLKWMPFRNQLLLGHVGNRLNRRGKKVSEKIHVLRYLVKIYFKRSAKVKRQVPVQHGVLMTVCVETHWKLILFSIYVIIWRCLLHMGCSIPYQLFNSVDSQRNLEIQSSSFQTSKTWLIITKIHISTSIRHRHLRWTFYCLLWTAHVQWNPMSSCWHLLPLCCVVSKQYVNTTIVGLISCKLFATQVIGSVVIHFCFIKI